MQQRRTNRGCEALISLDDDGEAGKGWPGGTLEREWQLLHCPLLLFRYSFSFALFHPSGFFFFSFLAISMVPMVATLCSVFAAVDFPRHSRGHTQTYIYMLTYSLSFSSPLREIIVVVISMHPCPRSPHPHSLHPFFPLSSHTPILFLSSFVSTTPFRSTIPTSLLFSSFRSFLPSLS